MKRRTFLVLVNGGMAAMSVKAHADNKSGSPYAKVNPIDLKHVQLTKGFWAERYHVNLEHSLKDLWERAIDPELGHVTQNFEIAANRRKGTHKGTFWQDAWLFKWIESACYILANDKNILFINEKLSKLVEEQIELIAAAQEKDGYLATQITAHPDRERFENFKHHELYTMGHMITAACVHFRITGKKSFLKVATKNADYVYDYFTKNEAKYPDFPNNPSIIMALADLYRVTRIKKYLDLANLFINMRGKYSRLRPSREDILKLPFHLRSYNTSEGRINNQNYIPLRKSKEVIGHAVFFTYLYAGAADAYLETGDKTLYEPLDRLWHDLTEKKMYVTGGVSPTHIGLPTFSYKKGVRKILKTDHVGEGVSAPYDLPNAHGYNETCGMIGNMMWNWRMLQATGEARFADIMELNWFNSILSGVELDGSGWSYANPLRWHREDHEVLHEEKYSHKRGFPGPKLICCPTNVLRNIASYAGFLYGLSTDTLWVHHYAGSELKTVHHGSGIEVIQKTEFPWDGNIKLELNKIVSSGINTIKFRIPYWAEKSVIKVNGKDYVKGKPGTYAEIKRAWKDNDVIELDMPMPVKLLVSDYLMETTRGQVAIKRGPVVYCLESIDLPKGIDIKDVIIPSDAKWEHEFQPHLLGGVTVLKTIAEAVSSSGEKIGGYTELGKIKTKKINIQLIPYFAWNNREEPKMSVWLPLSIRSRTRE